ncbi:unnamed protein product [Notodromas monacha]|uniref:Uncharacterized protein n=1 Tax=Notodromas monacha TaxID=399045 RepID=A0A7R9BSF3_9CRUS|nr:unnamed protein product [Notodromas monacha]CAG0919476.1 unnamed protein product [Notodromas monacha]
MRHIPNTHFPCPHHGMEPLEHQVNLPSPSVETSGGVLGNLGVGLTLGTMSGLFVFFGVWLYSKYQDYQYWNWYYRTVLTSNACAYDDWDHVTKHGIGNWFENMVLPPMTNPALYSTIFPSSQQYQQTTRADDVEANIEPVH